VLEPVISLMKEESDLVTLIKPQFEAGREQVGKGGVVRDPAVHEQVVSSVVDFAAVDVAFISLKLVLEPVISLMKEESDLVTLIKPQFEAGREQVSKGGVVRDPAVHEQVVSSVVDFAVSIGLAFDGTIESPLLGPAGNREFLAHFLKSSTRS
jgi:23S rRNA (cytidine1920-2'-O)/16S rRNA (cytidine1409-2'-O)-methyltransferase